MGDSKGMPSRLFAVVALALTGAALGGCGDDQLFYIDAAERARELQLLEDVEIVEMSREEFAALAGLQASQNADQLRQYAETYGRLGFFDVDLDLEPIASGSSSDWVGATYAPSAGRVTLVGDARDDIVVHELVHALQDQHFDLIAYDDHETSDSFLARRAVVEGDAVLAQTRFLLEQDGGRTFDDAGWRGLFASWRQFSDDTLAQSSYPVVFLDYLSFTYMAGFEYSAANLTGVSFDAPESYRPNPHDWALQDQLFANRPPTTTQQVLGLDVFGGASDPVVEVGLTRVPAELANELSAVDWDSLGEWYVYLLLLPLERDGAVADGRSLARGWDGDKALFVRDRASGEHGVVWVSSWDDEDIADEIAAALWQLYGAQPPQDGFAATSGDGERIWIETRGPMVVAVKNVSDGATPVLVEAAFGGAGPATARARPPMAALVGRSWRSCHSWEM